MEKKERIIGFDLIRAVAAFMVVAIHSNVYYLDFRDGSFHWFIIMELTALCVIAVPLFFMVSGACNLVDEEDISLRRLYFKKIPKQFIPFLIWSLIYVFARIAMGKISFSPVAFISLLWEPAYYQFWFMYTLLGLYICIPLFQLLVQKAEKRVLQYILLIWGIGSVVLPAMVRYIPGFRLSSHFNFVFLEGYWGYFLLGAYLRKYPVENSKHLGWLLFVSGVCITGISAIIEWSFSNPDKYYGYVYGAYLLPGAVFASVGAFLMMQQWNPLGKIRELVVWFSGLSMGVYYVHTLIIAGLELFFVRFGNSLYACILKWVIACLLSVIFTVIIRRIRFLKKWFLPG